jgi:predicted TIM-barrel fold metal-dependent hydrolase
MAKEAQMADQDYFVALSECHMSPANADIAYYPDYKRFWESLKGVFDAWHGPGHYEELMTLRAAAAAASDGEMLGYSPGAMLIAAMDEVGIDVAFGLRSAYNDTTGYATCLSTNGYIIQQIAPYPDRLYLECNVGPVLRRGVQHANWELEYLVKNHNAVACKVYQVEDDGPLNDPRMWPFYEKANELGIPLTIHMGMAYIEPHLNSKALPIQLDDICTDFPDLKIIAYHMGWPYHEELFGLAGKHKNLFISITGIVGWFERAPYRGYHMIGEALEWAGPDKIMMGSDGPPFDLKRIVDYIRNLEMPEELQEKWGYPAITDEIRAKILGLNLARLTGIEVRKRVKAPAAG